MLLEGRDKKIYKNFVVEEAELLSAFSLLTHAFFTSPLGSFGYPLLVPLEISKLESGHNSATTRWIGLEQVFWQTSPHISNTMLSRPAELQSLIRKKTRACFAVSRDT